MLFIPEQRIELMDASNKQGGNIRDIDESILITTILSKHELDSKFHKKATKIHNIQDS